MTSKEKQAEKFDDTIEIVGAQEHNLRNIDLSIPKHQLVVITGISGSGKSSLAFDTLYAEGQRRYLETFSSYARQFMGKMDRPNVEKIDGLSPVISIEQKTTGWNPRSTVGTITEVYDFLRLLYARIGVAYSYISGNRMVKLSEEEIITSVINLFHNKKIVILAPVVRARKGHYKELFEQIRKQGYNKVRVNEEIQDIKANMQLDRYKTHDIEIVVDRLTAKEDQEERIRESLRTALNLGNGQILILDLDTGKANPFSKFLMDQETGVSYEEPSPNTFSFNSPYGACPTCNGLGQVTSVDPQKVIPDDTKSINDVGIVPLGEVRENMIFNQLRSISKKFKFTFSTPIREIPAPALELILQGRKEKATLAVADPSHSYDLESNGLYRMLERWYEDTSSDSIRKWAEGFMAIRTCDTCNGLRLRVESLNFKIKGKNISELANMSLDDLYRWFDDIESHLSDKENIIAAEVLKEIRFLLKFLLHVGLDYLSLNRPARTLSGGESQRTRLANQIGSQLTGITYIMDEPSIGLHQKDNQQLIEALKELRDIGNSVLVVEHDKDIMLASDYIIDLGPGAGKHGGYIVGQGTPEEFLKSDTITSKYLSGELNIEIPEKRRKGSGNLLKLEGATGHNLKNVSVSIPLGTFVCITGVSGSGKSSLINQTLYPILKNHFYRTKDEPLSYKKIEGLEFLDKVIEIDQSPIGRSPRSNPATYTGMFNDIRKIYTELPESKIRGYKPGRFSFNVKGGRCETCEGGGMRVIEMNFLPDVLVPCETCNGKRYNRETLEILYKGKSISDVLDMTVEDAVSFFEPIPSIYRKVKTLNEVGLGYITLGQQATTLSGGEAQRVKLAEELSKKDTGKTIYILDEPTTGLHFEDIKHLLIVLQKLVDKGNSVLVIEHHLDVIKVADHVIDLGPGGGNKGGTIVASGTPEAICKSSKSVTGIFLAQEMKN